MPSLLFRRSWPMLLCVLTCAVIGLTSTPLLSAEAEENAPITFRIGDRVLKPGETIRAENGAYVRVDCTWMDGGQARVFQTYLWAPAGEAAIAVVPGEDDVQGLGGGLNIHSGFALLQGLTGTLPRSKSGGGRATGRGTTIVVWASQLGRPRLYRGACLVGRCDVNGLKSVTSDGVLKPLNTQFCTQDSFMEWDDRGVTATDGESAIRRPMRQNTSFESAVKKMLKVTGVTPS